jgi:hypothetical protein
LKFFLILLLDVPQGPDERGVVVDIDPEEGRERFERLRPASPAPPCSASSAPPCPAISSPRPVCMFG